MDPDHRQYRRIEKNLTMQFCLVNASPKKWDISVIDNISAGGVRFKAPSDLELNGQDIQLQIKIPELAPHWLELEAIVLDVQAPLNGKFSHVRAKFINLSDINKKKLAVIERMIDTQEMKNAKNTGWKKI